MSFRKAAILAVASGIALAGAAFAQQRAPYMVLNPAQPAETDKVEVLEFFSYACPHCYSLEPAITAWQKTMPKDVVFKRVPAVGSTQWTNLASVFFTVEAMGLLEQNHGKIFDAIHKQNVNLGNEKLRDEWLAKNGIDAAKFKEVEKSFSVMTKLQRARQMAGNYKVDSVPRFVVNGKYVVSSETVGDQSQMMSAVDVAVANSRREMAASAPAAPAPAGTAKR